MSDAGYRPGRPGRRFKVTGPAGSEYAIELLPDGGWAIPSGEESWVAFAHNAPRELQKLALEALRAQSREAPVVDALLGSCGSCVSFWCPWCRRRHFHGAPDGCGEGHRVAHCFRKESPYRETGYVLRQVPGTVCPCDHQPERRRRIGGEAANK